MKRRSFLAALFAAPIAPVAAKASASSSGEDAAGELKHVVPYRDGSLPLVYEDGILKIQNANVGAVMTGGVWRSPSGDMRFDLTNHTVVLIR